MGIKIYKKQDNNIGQDTNPVLENSSKYYDTPKLIRRSGIYYIGYLDDEIQIEEWEEQEVYENPDCVYDLIVSYRRKYYFNTAEDSLDSLQHY